MKSFAVVMVHAAMLIGTTATSPAQSQILLRSSTGSGQGVPAEFYQKLALGVSTNGYEWHWIYTKPTLTNFCRDASIIRFNGEFISVYTDAFESTNGTFGIARSTDLVNWTATNVKLAGAAMTNTPNNTWAPEWFVEDGQYYVLVRSSQTRSNNYGAPGICYLECKDPGTWTNWSDFNVLPGPRSNENDPFLLKVGSTYHLFTDDGGNTGTGNILHRVSTTGAFAGYGEPVVVSTNFRQAAALTNSAAWWSATPFEGQFVLPLGGDSYRLYFQATWWDNSFAIESTNGMQTWEISTMRQLTYNGLAAYGHGSVMTMNGSETVVPLAALAKRADDAVIQVQTIQSDINSNNLFTGAQYTNNRFAGRADVLGDPVVYGLYTSSSITDLNLGGVMLQKSGNNATISLQIQTTTNLSMPFTNSGAPVSLPVDLSGDKHFLRVRALSPQ
ncbi:MAG: hypothetical protein FGM15_05635 [Chthoniobacterales bacterium]|nr:hypothetical protein [Chthoniobacterales bacterium]